MKAFGSHGQLLIPGMNWCIVRKPMNLDVPFKEADIESFECLMEEIQVWLQEQRSQGAIEFWDYDGFNSFAFVHDEDAMAFKLRWL